MAAKTEAELEAEKAELDASMTEEEIALINELIKNADPSDYGSADMPGDTIVTEPYFSDVLVPVMLVGSGPQGK